MTRAVEFFLDVGSPYTYLAYKMLPEIAARQRARIVWRPFLLGGVFQASGNHSPATVPAKLRSLDVDLLRWSRHFGIPFALNPHFPINTVQIMRGAIAVQQHGEADLLRYLDAMFTAVWVDQRNLNDADELATVLREAGFDAAMIVARSGDAEIKQALRAATEEAVARGAFGAPTFFVGDDMFWGQDRLMFVERALAALPGGA